MDGEGPLAGFLARSRYQGGPFGLSGGGLQPASRLSYDEYQKRKSQNNKSSGEDQGPKGDSSDAAAAGKGVESMARGEEIGASFRYTIDQKVSLARNKSSLIPIIGQDVAVTRLSIFNESVQSKFPLLGVRFKNTSGNHLMQGPIFLPLRKVDEQYVAMAACSTRRLAAPACWPRRRRAAGSASCRWWTARPRCRRGGPGRRPAGRTPRQTPMSLHSAVTTEMSLASPSAGSGRPVPPGFRNSAASCWASVALPPLPKASSRPPAANRAKT